MRWLFELELLRILDKCNVIDDLKGYISYFEHQTYEFDEGITLHRVDGFLTIEQAPFLVYLYHMVDLFHYLI